jgi:hypothetical protein
MKYSLLILIFALSTFIGYAYETEVSSVTGSEQAFTGENSRNELRIYPNPAINEQVTMELISMEIKEVRLINIAGRELVVRTVEPGISKYQLNLEDVPNGIYFIRVKTSDNKVVVKKLVVSAR